MKDKATYETRSILVQEQTFKHLSKLKQELGSSTIIDFVHYEELMMKSGKKKHRQRQPYRAASSQSRDRQSTCDRKGKANDEKHVRQERQSK